jgi:predicted O-methyltransferase YrrM
MSIGCVITSRNDGYGGNLEERATHCINSLIKTFDEIIYVDWASENNSLIAEIREQLTPTDKFKYIIISPKEANELVNGQPSQACVEVLGRNIGIRRLTTDFILSTNIDVICPTRNYFSELTDLNTFYIGARRNIPLEEVKSQEELMVEAERWGQVGDSGAFPGDTWSKVNCCGDFQYAHRSVWAKIKGFEEGLIGRGFSDSNVQKKAEFSGYELKVVREIPFFHINHGGGFGGSGVVNDSARYLRDFIHTENKDTWGFSDREFKFYTLKDKEMVTDTTMDLIPLRNFFNSKKNTASDINEHLQFLHDLVLAVDAKQVVELGVRDGSSTSAFLYGVAKIGGQVWSCDLGEPIGEVNNFRSYPIWEFNQDNDLSFDITSRIPVCDVLFIDTGHLYDETLQEMETYSQYLRDGGVMVLHDSWEPNYLSEYAAIRVWLDRHKECDFYNFTHNHGMAVICKNQKFNDKVRSLLG